MTTEGVGWASEEASDLVVPPLNLMLYTNLFIGNTKFQDSHITEKFVRVCKDALIPSQNQNYLLETA